MLKRFTAILFSAIILSLAVPVLAQDCFTYGGTQFYESMHVCVSSPLAAQGGNTYGPANLGDNNPATAWCEAPHGGEQWVEVTWPSPQTFRTVLIANGYAKSETAYRANSRPRRIRVSTDDGLVMEADLLDQAGYQRLSLPRTVTAQAMRITVLSTYPGDTYGDTCMDELSVDLEELNY